jgi:hypothetical protein
MKKIILTLIVIYSLFLLTACPSPATIEKAKTNSKKIATIANEGVNITRELYQSKIINASAAKSIADKFIVLAEGGIAFDAAVLRLEKAHGASVPKSELEKLFSVFSTEVVQKFIDVLASLKILNVSESFKNTILLVQTAVITIARAFDRGKQVKQRIEAVA